MQAADLEIAMYMSRQLRDAPHLGVRPNLAGRRYCVPCSWKTSQLVTSLWECVNPRARSSAMQAALRKATTYAWRQPLDRLGPLPWTTLSLCTVMSPACTHPEAHVLMTQMSSPPTCWGCYCE